MICSVSPEDCACCIGLPSSKDRFYEAADPDRFDYIPAWCSSYPFPSALNAVWEIYNQYHKIPMWIERLTEQLVSYNVDVRVDATRNDLEECLKSKKVVIVLAHWAKKSIRACDILDPKGVRLAASSRSNHIMRAVDDTLQSYPSTHEDDPNSIAECLNQFVIMHDERRKASTKKKCRLRRQLRIRTKPSVPPISQIAIEYHFTQMILSKNGLELSDGILSGGDLLKAIPCAKPRVLDLASCCSTDFTELVSKFRRRCRAIAPYQQVHILPCILLTGKVIQAIHKHPRSYIKAYTESFIELKNISRMSHDA